MIRKGTKKGSIFWSQSKSGPLASYLQNIRMLHKLTNFPSKSAVPGVNSMSQPLKTTKEYNLRLTSFQDFSVNSPSLARPFEISCWPRLQGVGLENSGHSLPFPCSLEFSREQQYRILKIYIQQHDNPHLQTKLYKGIWLLHPTESLNQKYKPQLATVNPKVLDVNALGWALQTENWTFFKEKSFSWSQRDASALNHDLNLTEVRTSVQTRLCLPWSRWEDVMFLWQCGNTKYGICQIQQAHVFANIWSSLASTVHPVVCCFHANTNSCINRSMALGFSFHMGKSYLSDGKQRTEESIHCLHF